MTKEYLLFIILVLTISTEYIYGQKNNFKWIEIPDGSFLYGMSNDTVFIPYKYQISETEITNKQYLEFLNDALKQNKIKIVGNRIIGYYTGDKIWRKRNYTYLYYKNNTGNEDIFEFDGSRFSIKKNINKQNHPINYVTWFGAFAFAKFYGLRLPTNMEWEKAARGVMLSVYPWGDNLDNEHTNFINSSDPFDNGTTPVKFYNGQTKSNFTTKDNSSIYGAYDMIGNVSEWTNSYSDKYPRYRIYRGGSWQHKEVDLANYLTSEGGPELATDYIGFRCVK
ncbi:MAG: formylglycine-generating enzyme family protein [Arcobacter sp.]|nr:formylglycine-generating enzyme family protein [Arcobacter sp.]